MRQSCLWIIWEDCTAPQQPLGSVMLYYAFIVAASPGWGDFECAAFASVLAATDPVAVVGLLKERVLRSKLLCGAVLGLQMRNSSRAPQRCPKGWTSTKCPCLSGTRLVLLNKHETASDSKAVLHRFRERLAKDTSEDFTPRFALVTLVLSCSSLAQVPPYNTSRVVLLFRYSS